MPPIMGATAFVMATYLEVAYIEVALAAIIPSVLYFFGLFCQIDARAARTGAEGLPREDLPSVRETLREGWYFIAVFALLIWMLLVLNQESWAPYFSTAALLVVNQLSRANRWGRAQVAAFFAATGRLFVELVAILAGIGFIVGSLVMTGKIGNIANDLLQLAGGNLFALLFMGAATAFVLGIGMTVTAAYIFLAVALAPALVEGGLNPMAVHLFILYWGMLSYITPPVALGAFAAASLSGARPMATGFQAMRLGSIIYAVPFFFVLEPALILQGDALTIAATLAQALVGIALISAALENHLIGFGGLGLGVMGVVARLMLGFAGLVLALPGGSPLPFSTLSLLILAVGLAGGALVAAVVQRRFTASHSAGVS
jgi:TRAP transporter 4TM/12TM fusion protein